MFHAPDFVLAPVRQARTVVTVHDLTFRIHPETAFPRLRRFLEVAVPRSLRRADRVVAVSHSTARDVEQQLGIAPTKLRVIQHGLNTHFRRVDDAARLEHIRERYGLHAPFLLHVGTIEPRKNLERLMDAFAQLRSPQPLELVLGGRQGWLAAPIVAHAARTPGVRLLGPIDDADLPGVYSLAQGLAYPSLYEGFGFPALEALACGTPVVASRTSSIPEVVGDAALLIAPQDTDALRAALQRLLDEPQLTAAARSAGPIQAASFSWERAARELLAVYREVA